MGVRKWVGDQADECVFRHRGLTFETLALVRDGGRADRLEIWRTTSPGGPPASGLLSLNRYELVRYIAVHAAGLVALKVQRDKTVAGVLDSPYDVLTVQERSVEVPLAKLQPGDLAMVPQPEAAKSEAANPCLGPRYLLQL